MGETGYRSSEDVNESKEQGEDMVARKKKRTRKDLVGSTEKRGICYLSRVPPHMDPASLRGTLSKYGDLQRIYLVPQDHNAQVQRKQVRGFRGKQFSEGWVEFTDKRIAKRVAGMLNGEQIGGRRRSTFYYDIWNIKYLSKFKWDDLTNEIANKNRTREQKLAMEISAAKRERDFYMSKVDQSHALNSMRERIKKVLKLQMIWNLLDLSGNFHRTDLSLMMVLREHVISPQIFWQGFLLEFHDLHSITSNLVVNC